MDARDQAAVDRLLCDLDGTPNKARLGANAIVAVSMAVLHAAAADAREPLWRYLAEGRKVRVPLPEIQIFGGGAHAGRRTDVQDRSEEHTSELQSLMRISYAVFCLKNKQPQLTRPVIFAMLLADAHL